MLEKVTIIGRLGKDPELRYTASGVAVTTLDVATDRYSRKEDGPSDKATVWWKVVVWDKKAEQCKRFLSKGRQVYVEGQVKVDPQTGAPRIWTGRDGNPRTSLEMTAYRVLYLGNRNDAPGSVSAPPVETDDWEEEGEEEIPF